MGRNFSSGDYALDENISDSPPPLEMEYAPMDKILETPLLLALPKSNFKLCQS